MKNKSKIVFKQIGQFFVIFVLVLLALAICLYVFHIPAFYPQILAISASACLGAVVTSWITKSLLASQKESEEEKEKNIKIYEKKIVVYSVFISKLWKTMSDGYLNEDELRDIRSEVFNKLIFYLGIDDIKKLSDEITKIKDLQTKLSEDKVGVNPKDSGFLVKSYSEITNLLRNDIIKGLAGNDALKNATNELSDLWVKFGIQPVELAAEKQALDSVSSQDNNVVCPSPSTTEENNEVPQQDTHRKRFVQAWHFAMWDGRQLEAIGEGKINELSLVEYEEEWRTNLVKQVEKDDIVFLFQRGGNGYIGAFKPLGWRIFDYEEKRETIYYFEKDEEQTVPINEEDVKRYDIYEGYKDGASLCANLIVDPIKYIPNGVGNPGGVYRRTISRYDAGYAETLLEWFKINDC